MHVGRAQIVVVLMGVTMSIVAVIVPMAFAEQECAADVHCQAKNSDPGSFPVCDIGRSKQALDRADAYAEGNDRQDKSAGKARQIADLPSAESEPLVVGMAPRIGVRPSGNTESARMGSHVEAISQQRH
jgi:hypothetical protein